jgi:DNA-binding NarL/FixJ family response regulator
LPVLMYSMHSRPRYVQRSRTLGASGYLVKGAGVAELVQAIHQASRGKSCWPEDIS